MVSPTSKLRKKQDVSEKGQGVRGHVVGGKGDDGGYVREGHTSGGRGKMEIGKMQSRGNAEVAEMEPKPRLAQVGYVVNFLKLGLKNLIFFFSFSFWKFWVAQNPERVDYASRSSLGLG